MLFYAEGKSIKDVIDIRLATVGDDYLKTLGFTILAGRGFSKDFTADSNSIILNEAALKEFGYGASNAVGKNIYFDFQGTHNTMHIVGVVKNFNFESLYNPIKPFAFTTILANKYSYVIANVATKNYTGLLKDMKASWNRVNPDLPFVYSFLDNDFQKNYEKDERVSGIVGYFTLIAILISCIGLFGLSVLSAEKRTKEIGIRKVLGASVNRVVAILSKDFLKLVLISLVIAIPAAWMVANKWLQNCPYRITLSWRLFASAGILVILIALITVSFQAIKAAIANPVKSLERSNWC